MKNRKPIHDISLWLLLVSNLITIFFAVFENWNLSTVLWIYWSQSVIIGFFNFIRILQLKDFSTEGFEINNQPAVANRSTKIFTAFFFLVHYGLFHFGYLAFLSTWTTFHQTVSETNKTEPKVILLAAGLFFINHLFSYIYNKNRDSERQNIGKIMFAPYARIVPMHLFIILGSMFGGGLVFFLLLKTAADLVMHSREHFSVNQENDVMS